MKTSIFAAVLATVVSSSYANAPTAALNHDPATYRNVTQKATADYKAAIAKCSGLSGNAKDVCTEEAKAARARNEANAMARYNSSEKGRLKAHTTVANADYALAKAKCDAMSGADKDACLENARSKHTAALNDAKAGREMAVAGGTDADKAAAVEKCERIAGRPDAACLVENRASTTPSGAVAAGSTAGSTAGRMADRTESAAETAAEKARRAASTVAEKTREAASTVVEKTRNAASSVAGRTDRTTDNVEQKSERAASRTGEVVDDSVITTKVKAELFKEPELKSMAIHVETENGTVMLSGFVDSQADAERARRVASSVEGVTKVESAIKVK